MTPPRLSLVPAAVATQPEEGKFEMLGINLVPSIPVNLRSEIFYGFRSTFSGQGDV
jgi:hypothetical protein